MLNADTIAQMKKLSKFTPAQVDAMLQDLVSKDADTWRNAINILVLTLWTLHGNTRKGVEKLGDVISRFAEGGAGAEGAQAAAGAGPTAPAGPPAATVGGPVIGADGAPITDPAQIEAERIMNAAAGPSAGAPSATAPAPGAARAPRASANGGGAPIIGADGQPITDPAQIEAERIMNETVGP